MQSSPSLHVKLYLIIPENSGRIIGECRNVGDGNILIDN